MEWILNNLATIIISLMIVAVLVAIIIKIVRDKKSGKTSCSCGCQNCAMKDKCHK